MEEEKHWSFILGKRVTDFERDREFLKLQQNLHAPVEIGTLQDLCLKSLVSEILKFENSDSPQGNHPADGAFGLYRELIDYYTDLQYLCSQGKITV